MRKRSSVEQRMNAKDCMMHSGWEYPRCLRYISILAMRNAQLNRLAAAVERRDLAAGEHLLEVMQSSAAGAAPLLQPSQLQVAPPAAAVQIQPIAAGLSLSQRQPGSALAPHVPRAAEHDCAPTVPRICFGSFRICQPSGRIELVSSISALDRNACNKSW